MRVTHTWHHQISSWLDDKPVLDPRETGIAETERNERVFSPGMS